MLLPGYPELNFPSYLHKTKKEKDIDYIWDPSRKSWIKLTPEEWVRQNLLRYLKEEMLYPEGLTQVECALKVGKRLKRFDLVVMDRDLQPWLICECKAPNIQITNSVLEQAAIYNSTLKCPYLSVTNGLHHYCFKIDFLANTTTPLVAFPAFGEKNLEDWER